MQAKCRPGFEPKGFHPMGTGNPLQVGDRIVGIKDDGQTEELEVVSISDDGMTATIRGGRVITLPNTMVVA